MDNSPVHLKNTINLNWEYVGIGVAKGKDGLYYITQEFSSRNIEVNPLTETEIQNHIDEMTEALIRRNNRPFKEDKTLSKTMKLYQKYNRLNSFTLKVLLENKRIGANKFVNVTIPVYGKNFVGELEKKGFFEIDGFSNVSVGLNPKKNSLEIAMIYY